MKLAELIGATEPTFDEPWQAQAFAMTVALHERGAFGWDEWANTLSAHLATDPDDDGTRYWTHWLAALEEMLAAHGMADGEAISARQAEWHDAAARTPHGEPIELSTE